MKIHHLGIVVSDIDEALASLGLDHSHISEVIVDSNQKNNLHFVHLPQNDMWLELVQPISEDSTTAQFARKFSIGLHHLGMGTDNLEDVEERYTARPGNFVLGRYQIRVDSFGGKLRTLFVAAKGLILEFIQVEK